MANPAVPTPALVPAALATVAALLLALFDWPAALMLLAALALGWAFVLAFTIGATVYRRIASLRWPRHSAW